jgi:hypothetical protein
MKLSTPLPRLHRWTFGLLTLGFALTAAADADDTHLSGRILQEDQSPVTNATVFVYSARPKHGAGVVCPSCYPDCVKRAKTSSTGEFRLPSLDPQLTFRLLVIANGFESQFVPQVDPNSGAKTITLSPVPPEKLKSPDRIAGRVLDGAGQPLPGATLSPEGVATGSSTQWGGVESRVDPLVVTDENGQFQMYCTQGVDRVFATVEGRGVARRWVELKSGRDHLVRMQEGVAVSGNLRHAGRPVKDVVVSLVTRDRACGRFLRGDEVATDADGFFLLPNVAPEREFVLFAKMDSTPGDGELPPLIFSTGASGSRKDFGSLELKPAFRIAGQVRLSDGRAVPQETRLLLSRELAWDHREVLLDESGNFELRGVPAESVNIHVRIPGYKMSKRNRGLDWLNGGLVGRVDRDIDNLVILLEPGKWDSNEPGGAPDGNNQPYDKSLFGITP